MRSNIAVLSGNSTAMFIGWIAEQGPNHNPVVFRCWWSAGQMCVTLLIIQWEQRVAERGRLWSFRLILSGRMLFKAELNYINNILKFQDSADEPCEKLYGFNFMYWPYSLSLLDGTYLYIFGLIILSCTFCFIWKFCFSINEQKLCLLLWFFPHCSWNKWTTIEDYFNNCKPTHYASLVHLMPVSYTDDNGKKTHPITCNK